MKQQVDRPLQAALRELGYVRVTGNVLRAPWSSGVVDQFIHLRWFNWFGASAAVGVSVAVRHTGAHAFARTVLPYDLPTNRRTDSFAWLDVGRLCAWSDRWLLFLEYLEPERSAGMIVTGLERRVRPLLCGVREDETMYEFLTRTIIAEDWSVNGTAVAAEAIYLGKRIGHRKDDVLKRIAPGRRFITASQVPGRNIDDFLEEVWERA